MAGRINRGAIHRETSSPELVRALDQLQADIASQERIINRLRAQLGSTTGLANIGRRTIQDDGTDELDRDNLNFVAPLTVTDNASDTISVGLSLAGTDHGGLGGLADDDHPQYVLAAGDTMTGNLIMDDGGAPYPSNAIFLDATVLWAIAMPADGSLAIVKAGAGGTDLITLGGASSTVSVLNLFKAKDFIFSELTAVGDLAVSSDTSGTLSRFGVGANGTLLQADSGEALGMGWDTTLTGNYTFSASGTAVAITNNFDVDGWSAFGGTPTTDTRILSTTNLTGSDADDAVFSFDATTSNSTTHAAAGGPAIAYGARCQANMATTTGTAKAWVIGGQFRARLQSASGTFGDSANRKLIGGHFVVEGVNAVTLPNWNSDAIAGRFEVDLEDANWGGNVYGWRVEDIAIDGGAATGTLYGGRIGDVTAAGSPSATYSLYIDAQDGANQSADDGNVYMAGGNWNTGHLQLEAGHVWWDATNDCLRVSKDADGSSPTAEDDGIPIPLSHAEIYAADANDTITITTSGKANKVQITSFTANGQSYLDTPDHTNDHITILDSGIFLVTCSIHLKSAAAGGADTIGYSVYVNNGATELTNLHGQRDLGGGGSDEGSVSMSGLASLSASDTVEVWIWNNDSTDDIVVDDINLSVVRIK